MYDIFANWEIGTFCNFRCKYCFNSDKSRTYENIDMDDIINGFNNIGPTFLIHISGGEPYLYPHFVELCEGLTEKHIISINTNISTNNIYNFAERINPKRVKFIHCSLHIEERKRKNLIKDFIDKFHYLRDAGFEIFVTQVLHPSELEIFDRYFDLLKENGIVLNPKNFMGNYRYRHYPHSYSENERNKIINYIETAKNLEEGRNDVQQLLDLERELVYGDLSFRGQLCNAGKNSVTINPNGDVMRCHGIPNKIGNIFEGEIDFLKGPKLCSSKICPCPFFGQLGVDGTHKVVKISTIEDKIDRIINYWR